MILLVLSLLSFARADFIVGEAFINEKLAYIEKHFPSVDKDGRYIFLKTEYFYPNSKDRFAEIQSSFTKSSFLPDVYFFDERFRMEERISYDDKLKKLDVVRTQMSRREILKIDIDNPAIHGQGFHNFLIAHFESLRKERMVVNIAITARSDYYKFYVEKKSENEHEVEFVVFPKNIVLRQLVKEIKMKYSLADKRLLFYSGPSNLEDQNGKGQVVNIKYKYF